MRYCRLLAVICLVLAAPSSAEQLLVEDIRERRQSEPLDIPRGRTMDQVEHNRGEPGEIRGPIGEPPITQWIYDSYIVYFENERVIHTVVQR